MYATNISQRKQQKHSHSYFVFYFNIQYLLNFFSSYKISCKSRNDEGWVDEESSPPHPSLPQLLLEGLEDHQPEGNARQAAQD